MSTETGRQCGRAGVCRWWGVALLLVFFCRCLSAQSVPVGERAAGEEGWSTDLLARLLDPPTSGDGPSREGGMVLRSYQLQTLRLGSPGRATHLVNILRRMLPPDSRVTEDGEGNALHVLSSTRAQEAALEFISSMDVPTEVSVERAQVMPDEVRRALEALAATRPDAEQLRAAVQESLRRSEETVARSLERAREESRADLRTLLLRGLFALAICLLLLGAWVWRGHRSVARGLRDAQASSLALMPAQGMEAVLGVSRDQQDRTRELQALMESLSIAYQADRQRNVLMVETVAKRQEELGRAVEDLVELRRGVGETVGRAFLELNRDAIDDILRAASDTLTTQAREVGEMARSAGQRMEETASRLEVQNARTQALAEELERTQREVDALFERLRTAQEDAAAAQREAHEQRRLALEKTTELSRKEAALAGLSLLMQEPVSEILNNLQKIPSPGDGAACAPPEDPAVSEDGIPTLDNPRTGSPSALSPMEPSTDSPCPPTFHFRITPAA